MGRQGGDEVEALGNSSAFPKYGRLSQKAEKGTELNRAHLARRKEIYEALHPEAKAEERRKSGLKQYRDEIISPREEIPPTFTTATAAKLGVSPRTIRQGAQIATGIALRG